MSTIQRTSENGMRPGAPPYQAADVVLRDGSTAHVRDVLPSDEGGLLALYRGLSDQSRFFRFFTYGTNLEKIAQRACQAPGEGSFGLVALQGPEQRVVGHAGYERAEPERAEFALAVADELQGHGLGTILLGQLAQVGASQGIKAFEALILPSNHQMLDMLRQSGFQIQVAIDPDGLRITFLTSLSEAALDEFDRRDQIAAVNALRHFFQPSAVAVIGASRERGTVGGEVFHNLVAGEFAGPVYPVNARAAVVQSAAAYQRLSEVPGPVDLAVVAVPADQVLSAIEQCGDKAVPAVVILSAGFGEAAEGGRERQRALVEAIRDRGMRLIGPNCLGIINTDREIRLNATFGTGAPPAGRIGFMSQSGALGLAAVEYAKSLGLGISTFASVGNKADISANDLLSYWEADGQTDVILLYLESFGNPRKFSRVARRVGKSKPIVAVKSGRSQAGARAAGSHTGALLAASDTTVDALFRQSGVIRVDTVEELFGVASLLSSQPLADGNGVAIVTNAGGPGILCADTCEAHGLSVPSLAEETQAHLRAFLPAAAGTTNPVDMIASASAEQFRKTIAVVAGDPGVSAVIAIFLQPLATRSAEVATAIVDASRNLEGKIPVLAVFMSAEGAPSQLRQDDVRIPAYAFPEPAAKALAHAARYADWRRRRPSESPPIEGLRRDEASAIVASALGQGGGWLEPAEVSSLLDCYGIQTVAQQTARSPAEAASLSEQMVGPFALKGLAPGVIHKTEAGFVRLALGGPSDVERAAAEMANHVRDRSIELQGYVIQSMTSGVEMLGGIVQDPLFGPVVACGAGGVLVELMKDVAVRLTPICSDDAADMVRSLRSYALLTGFRGAPPADEGALVQVLLRLGALADDLPQVVELDCNPLMVGERGAVVVDARARVEAARPKLPIGGRA